MKFLERSLKFLQLLIEGLIKGLPYRAKLCRAKVTHFLKSDENFARRIISPDENFARQSFAQQCNQNLSK